MDLVAFHKAASPYTDSMVDVVNQTIDIYMQLFSGGSAYFWIVQFFILYGVIRAIAFVRSSVLEFGIPMFNGRMMDMKILSTETEVSLRVGSLLVEGRIDEIRITEVDDLIVGDIKTPLNHRISSEDIAELSLYRHLLAKSNPGRKVRQNGYFRLVDPDCGESHFVPVKLHDEKWFESLLSSYEEARRRKSTPSSVADVQVCKSCCYASGCLGVEIEETRTEEDAAISSPQDSAFLDEDDSNVTSYARRVQPYGLRASTRTLHNIRIRR